MLNINKKIFIVLIILLLSIKFSSAIQCPPYADDVNEFKSVTTQIVFDFLGSKTTLSSQEVSTIYNFYSTNKNNWNSDICTQTIIDILNNYYQIRGVPQEKIVALCDSNFDCNDLNQCTIDICNNPGEISSSCSQEIISSCVSGDGCCPSGCGVGDDNDCTLAVCGNGVKETGETCSTCSLDAACASGQICSNGACITATCNTGTCDDGNSCTIDTCSNPGTANAQCVYANKNLNSACLTSSGSSGICNSDSPKRICVVPICTSSNNCNDNNACTIDICNNPGRYNSACSITTISSCASNDGCCPSTCNANNDNNCNAVCGNGVKETGETCSTCSQDVSSTEVCDGIDNDCDSLIDEGSVCPTKTYYCDADSDGYYKSTSSGSCSTYNCVPSGCSTSVGDDCNDGNANVNPGKTEACNGIDDDCDGSIDEGLVATYYVDADGDGYGSSTSTNSCFQPSGYVTTTGDCNDGNANIKPGATETCNSIDDNCVNGIDESPSTICGANKVCSSGTCYNVACYSGADCDDENFCTVDKCGSPGTSSSYCFYSNVAANNKCFTPTNVQGVCNANNPARCVVPVCDENTDCYDGNACTSGDVCNNPGKYNAACSYTSLITACASNDGCCPSTCNANNDNNCNAVCGNGVKETGETCSNCIDAACPSGQTCVSGVCQINIACYTNGDCDDNNGCTLNTCNNAGTTSSFCSYPKKADGSKCVTSSGTTGICSNGFCSSSSGIA